MRSPTRSVHRVLGLAAVGLLLWAFPLACGAPAFSEGDGESARPAGSGQASAPQSALPEAVDAAGSTAPARLPGIDVSEFQGEIDWPAVKASGVVFAFARALEGETLHDPRFATNWQGMKEAGVVRGAYDFYVADDSPAGQVETFTGLVTLEPGDLVPMVDIEQGSLGASAPADLIADFHRYLQLMEQHYGVKPIIYTDPDFWNEYMDDSFGAYPLWVADYDIASPRLPKGWDSWILWQHSENGSVPGVDGMVDLDLFNGTLEDLARYRLPEPGNNK